MGRRLTFWHLGAQALVIVATVSAMLTTGDRANTGIVEESLGTPGSVFVVVLLLLAVPALVVGIVDGVLARRRGGMVRRLIRAILIVAFGALAALFVTVAAEGSCDGSCIDPPRGEILAGFGAAETALVVEWSLAAIIATIGVGQTSDPE
ncbi:MAG: hypothetical protein MUP97_00030 [Acidimicrobiia bacterium]|jgi:hypothetical protein|nr:hypothetical protein [Acidimicrobiia bacterium]